MQKLAILIITGISPLFGAGLDQVVGIMENVIGILTGTLLQVVVTIAAAIAGYLYLFQKGREGKEALMGILIGAGIILGASGIAELLSK